MTQKDFILIAGIIRDNPENFATNRQHLTFAERTAKELAGINPRFKRGVFIMACMPRAWVGTNKSTIWEASANA